MNELESKFGEYEDEQIGGTQTGFIIDTLEKADWAVQKIAAHEKKKAEIKAFADTKREKIKEFEDAEYQKIDASIEGLKCMLAPFVEAGIAIGGGKKKSIRLIGGTAGFRQTPPKFERDEVKLKEFVKNYDTKYIETKESVKWSEFKADVKILNDKMITKDGEIVDGVTVIPGEQVFYVKPEETVNP